MAPRSVAIDIVEENIQNIQPSLLNALLKDKTTGNNIIWATDDYSDIYGDKFARDREITSSLITGKYWSVIQPRTAKLKEKQSDRTKKRAEVFTPSWVCNEQNNLIDEHWFGRKNVFNEEHDKSWVTYHEKIEFPSGRTWQEYVDARRMEVTCGEAPYLASRYDTTTGERIKLDRRIGMLDRKFRIINENTTNDEEWMKWAIRAVQATYGYEFQGDNVLLARENILFTFIDYYKNKFKSTPDTKTLQTVINIIAWNIWQMDGRTYLPPYAVRRDNNSEQLALFDMFNDEAADINATTKNVAYCVLMNWRSKKKIAYKNLVNKENA